MYFVLCAHLVSTLSRSESIFSHFYYAFIIYYTADASQVVEPPAN